MRVPAAAAPRAVAVLPAQPQHAEVKQCPGAVRRTHMFADCARSGIRWAFRGFFAVQCVEWGVQEMGEGGTPALVLAAARSVPAALLLVRWSGAISTSHEVRAVPWPQRSAQPGGPPRGWAGGTYERFKWLLVAELGYCVSAALQ